MKLMEVTTADGTKVFVNPEIVALVGPAQKDGVPMVGQCVMQTMTGAYIPVQGTPSEVAERIADAIITQPKEDNQ